MKNFRVLSPLILVLPLLAACGAEGEGQTVEQRAIAVATARAEVRDVATSLHSIGRLVSENAPLLAAEVTAPVVEVLVDEGEAVEAGQVLVRLDTTVFELSRREAQAAISGLDVSIANEERRVKRYRDLKTTNAMSQEGLDDAEAQLASSKAAKAAAEARLAIAEDRLARAELVSPVSGVIERRHVSVGDYLRPGDPVMAVTDTHSLRAELPFPETVGHQLQVGQKVVLKSPNEPGLVHETEIVRIRPQVGNVNRALVAIAVMDNPGGWRPEGTVEADVIVEARAGAVVVPVVSLVERPAGTVVYVLAGETVREQVVVPGRRQNGWIEVRSGLEPGVFVVADGASYLTDGARVNVVEGES